MIPVFCDASSNRAGHIGIAWVRGFHYEAEYFRLAPDPSLSTIAEAFAIVSALDGVRTLRPTVPVTVYTDCSGLIPNQTSWYRKWIAASLALCREEGITVTLRWIPRHQNRVADLLARRICECEGYPFGKAVPASERDRQETWKALLDLDDAWARHHVLSSQLPRDVRLAIRQEYDRGLSDEGIVRALRDRGIGIAQVVSWRTRYGVRAHPEAPVSSSLERGAPVPPPRRGKIPA